MATAGGHRLDDRGTATVHGHDVVVSLGRTRPGQNVSIEIHGLVSSSLRHGTRLAIKAWLRSSTALPVVARTVTTTSGRPEDDDDTEQEPRH